MTTLDKEFLELAEQINAKIEEAAASLKEANKLAKKAGLKTIGYNYNLYASDYGIKKDEEEIQELMRHEIDYHPVLVEIDNAGWSTSSLFC